MNIYDVSKKAGVSIATVSRVLNGNSNVSEQTRQKVLKAMDDLDYTPNVFARGLGLNTMKTIGIMCTDSSDTYLANAIYFLEQSLRKHNYDAILCCTGNNFKTKKKYLNLLLSKRVDGIILAGSHFVGTEPNDDNSYIIEAAKVVPIVLVNGYLKGDNIYSVRCDDYAAIYDATTRLIESGRQSLIYLYSSTSCSGTGKLNGFDTACLDATYKNPDDVTAPALTSRTHMCTKSIAAVKEYLNSLYNEGVNFDAVVTSDDSLAVGAIKFAYEHGIKVPDQLSVIGYNNSVLADCTQPELTSIDSKVEQLSETAVNLLMKVLSGERISSENTVTADIIKRNTTNF